MEIKLTNISFKDFKKITTKITNDGILGITGENNDIFLKILTGTLDNKGSITYDKEKLTPQNKIELTKKISYIPHIFKNLYNKSTIEEYMTYMIQYKKLNLKDPRKKMIGSLKIVGLTEEYLSKKISILSTTERKQFQLAISLITNPKIILFEEPFTDFDANNLKKILRLLNQLNEKYKIMIIISSTNSDLLYKYTKNIIILKDNKILKKGNTKEVYEDVDFLQNEEIELPDIITFTYMAKKNKDVHIDYHRDIRDLIKDIYKHI